MARFHANNYDRAIELLFRVWQSHPTGARLYPGGSVLYRWTVTVIACPCDWCREVGAAKWPCARPTFDARRWA